MIEEIKDGNGAVADAASCIGSSEQAVPTPSLCSFKLMSELQTPVDTTVQSVLIVFPDQGDAFGFRVQGKDYRFSKNEGYSSLARVISRLRELAKEHEERQK